MISNLVARYRALVKERLERRDDNDLADNSVIYEQPTYNHRFVLSELIGNRHFLRHQLSIHINYSIFEADNFRAIELAEEIAHEQLVTDGMEKYRDYFIGGYVSNGTDAILVIQTNSLDMLTLAKLTFS